MNKTKLIVTSVLAGLFLSFSVSAANTLDLEDSYRDGDQTVCVYSDGRHTAVVYKDGAGSCPSKHTTH